MKIYTVSESFAGLGTEVVKFQAAGVVMSVVMVGEEGRGRCRGILPVRGLGPEAKRVECGRLASLPSGLPILIAGEQPDEKECVMLVLRTPLGFNGYNSHGGDATGWKCPSTWTCAAAGALPVPAVCPACGRALMQGDSDGEEWPARLEYAPLPGRVIVRGVIAQGDAGHAGHGEEIVMVAPIGSVISARISGRRYGRPHRYFYHVEPDRVLAATWEERMLTGVF